MGSGKTIVAALAACQAIEAGYQVAFMAPTELLAEQHYNKLIEWLEPLGIRIAWLSGSQKKSDRTTQLSAAASDAQLVVGMSLGGMTAVALADHAPHLVRRLALVDVTPGVDGPKSQQIANFINGPESFPNFDELLARTIEFNPTRTESSLRRGILHNAMQLDDGTWVWRYRRMMESGGEHPDFSALWDAIGASTMPLLLARGMLPQSVVDDADEAELLRRRPDARIVHVDNAGHSIQGDQPVELARILGSFLES